MEIHKILSDKYLEKSKNLKPKLNPSTFAQIENCLKENTIELSEIKKEISEKKFLHNPNDYPIYPNDSDDPEGFYANMYNYLFKRKNQPYAPNYPNYIYQILNETEAETKKRAFRKKAEKFDIDQFGFLCFKLP